MSNQSTRSSKSQQPLNADGVTHLRVLLSVSCRILSQWVLSKDLFGSWRALAQAK